MGAMRQLFGEISRRAEPRLGTSPHRLRRLRRRGEGETFPMLWPSIVPVVRGFNASWDHSYLLSLPDHERKEFQIRLPFLFVDTVDGVRAP
jgi:hypothetical protein